MIKIDTGDVANTGHPPRPIDFLSKSLLLGYPIFFQLAEETLKIDGLKDKRFTQAVVGSECDKRAQNERDSLAVTYSSNGMVTIYDQQATFHDFLGHQSSLCEEDTLSNLVINRSTH